VNRIKQLRKQKGMTQKECATLLQVAHSTFSYWENGTHEPDTDTIKKIADYFGVSIDYLLGNSSNLIPDEEKGVKIPVLGRIPAGIPVEAIEDLVDWEEIPSNWTRGNQEYFALKIRGDSMSPKYLNGDTVIFLKVEDCENGAECAVIVNGQDATFKKVIKHRTGIMLQPLNTTEYEPVFYSADEIEEMPVRIVGIAKELRRRA